MKAAKLGYKTHLECHLDPRDDLISQFHVCVGCKITFLAKLTALFNQS